MYGRAFSAMMASFVITVLSVPAAAEAARPTEDVRTHVESIMDILRMKEEPIEERQDKVYDLVRNWFDFRVMSQGVLATNWRKASDEEKDRFTELFTTLLETTYCELGKKRCREEVPLSQVVQALILVKDHLRQYVLSSGLVSSAVELYGEEELNLRVGHFFDKAIYFVVKGYEAEARTRGTSRPGS